MTEKRIGRPPFGPGVERRQRVQIMLRPSVVARADALAQESDLSRSRLIEHMIVDGMAQRAWINSASQKAGQ